VLNADYKTVQLGVAAVMRSAIGRCSAQRDAIDLGITH